jgi:predicted nuclease of restriction endonuclease-like (RecB) superfamily
MEKFLDLQTHYIMTTNLLAKPNSSQLLPINYKDFFEEIKKKILEAQLRASLSVNSELVKLYWSIGKSILEKQSKEGWGAKIIDRMAKDLATEFPGISGFSVRNLKYMRKFAEIYPDPQFVQTLLAQIPWWHNILLIEKLKDPDARNWYAHQVLQKGWSGRALEEAIKSNLYKRQGKAVTNFKTCLPDPHSRLAIDILKSPYNFGFLSLTNDYVEKELERGLIDNLEKLILELGQGFAFIGRQYHIEIAGDDYYLDMLFYHIKLRCFCVVELKTTDFKPEYAGKLNFYLAAVDRQIKHPSDNPSIGMIICRTKNDLKVEYSLERSTMPMGVSEYEVTILDTLPKELEGTLPTAAEIEAKLTEHRTEDASDRDHF